MSVSLNFFIFLQISAVISELKAIKEKGSQQKRYLKKKKQFQVWFLTFSIFEICFRCEFLPPSVVAKSLFLHSKTNLTVLTVRPTNENSSVQIFTFLYMFNC